MQNFIAIRLIVRRASQKTQGGRITPPPARARVKVCYLGYTGDYEKVEGALVALLRGRLLSYSKWICHWPEMIK